MPPVLGGAPTCPTCQQKVYFAEQTLGPGGRAFHKLCLKCVGCGKSLEPRLLVDHDGEAYCKSCHGKSFGTKGYGAGGALVGEYQPRSSPTRPATTSTANSPANSPVRPPAPSFASQSSPSRPLVPPKPSFSSSSLSSVSNLPPTPPPRVDVASHPIPREIPPPSFETQSSSTSRPLPTPPTTSSSAETRPINSTAAPHSTPAFSDDEDDSRASSSTTSNRRPLPFPPSQFALKSVTSSPDLCRRCGTQVYFAEQIIAVGSKWHKRCLRCASCSTTLNSHLLEKDRLPYCKKCYQENFGTGSLGITSRPTLY